MNENRMPGLGVITRQQFRLLMRTGYVMGLAAIIALGSLPRYIFNDLDDLRMPWERQPAATFAYIIAMFIGMLAAVITWFNENPRARKYHWSKPVSREVHDLSRIFAGAAWLMALIAVLCIAVWLAEDEVMREQWLNRAPLFWLGMFAVPLLVYLLAMVPTLLSAHPLAWIIGAIFVITSLGTTTVIQSAPALGRIGYALFHHESRGTLGAALTGGAETAPWTSGSERQRVFQAVADDIFRTQGQALPPREDFAAVVNSDRHEQPNMQPRAWFEALAIWYAIALLGVTFALRRRPDV